jgi:Fe-S-cluster containining protein
MSIRDFSVNLQILYREMGETFSSYQSSTGLACLSGCGRCCINPDIEASTLEMIPFALHIYDEGKMDEWLIKTESKSSESCLLFKGDLQGQGQCSSYEHRPSICRMFGVAGYYDKEHHATLSVCKFIREKYPVQTQDLNNLALLTNTPMLSYWNSKMSDLDQLLIQERMPINEAIHSALEKVSLYAQYQGL